MAASKPLLRAARAAFCLLELSTEGEEEETAARLAFFRISLPANVVEGRAEGGREGMRWLSRVESSRVRGGEPASDSSESEDESEEDSASDASRALIRASRSFEVDEVVVVVVVAAAVRFLARRREAMG